jgi:hypothetical protein
MTASPDTVRPSARSFAQRARQALWLIVFVFCGLTADSPTAAADAEAEAIETEACAVHAVEDGILHSESTSLFAAPPDRLPRSPLPTNSSLRRISNRAASIWSGILKGSGTWRRWWIDPCTHIRSSPTLMLRLANQRWLVEWAARFGESYRWTGSNPEFSRMALGNTGLIAGEYHSALLISPRSAFVVTAQCAHGCAQAFYVAGSRWVWSVDEATSSARWKPEKKAELALAKPVRDACVKTE